MGRVTRRGRRVRLVFLALSLAAIMVGAQLSLPGLAPRTDAQTKGTPTITTTPSAGGPVGTSISDSATVSGGGVPTPTPAPIPTALPSQPGLPNTGALAVSPTGTVTFALFPPSDPTCSGTPAFTSTNPLSAGTATSGSFTADTAGTWQWVATYSGDANNNSVSTACGDEPVIIAALAPVLDTTKSLSTVDGVAPSPPAFEVKAGADLVYIITVRNTGNAPGTTTLSDPVPAGTTYTGSGEGWSCAAGSAPGVNCTQSVTVGPGASDTVDYTVTVDNPLPAALSLTTIDNVVSSSSGTCSACSTSNPLMDRIYWTTGGGGTVMVANLDATHPTTLTSNPGCCAEGLAIANRQIYWTLPFGPQEIRQANLDGTGMTTLVTGQNNPFGITVANGHLYWANFSGGDNDGTIMVANLDGSNPTVLVSNLDCPTTPPTNCVDGPQQVVVAGGKIYWAATSVGSSRPSAIWSATLAPSGVTASGVAPVVQSGVTWPVMAPNTGRATGVAVFNGQVYWTLYEYGEVWKANLDGTGATLLVSGQTNPDYIALDPTIDSSHIYWTNQNGGTIMRANLDGSNPIALISGQTSPTGIALGPP